MAEHDLHADAFARLDEAQLAALERCHLTALKRYRDGETLFEVGDHDFKFFVVKSGAVAILDESGETPRIVTILRRGEFTGEVTQLTGGPSIVSGVAQGDCEVFEVSSDALRQLLNDHPNLGDVILQAFIARRQLLRESGDFLGVRVIGSRDSRDTFRVREFLAKNGVPTTWLDLEDDPQVKQLLARFGVTEAETPVVIWGRKLLLRNPSNHQLAEALGLRRPLEKALYDLTIVGAGPAGLAAAVYGASEGLSTVVLERTATGGQAGRSMRIENYLGFPTGITGRELAERAVVQADKFGRASARRHARHGLSRSTVRIPSSTSTAETVTTRLADRHRRRSPSASEGCERFEGCGVYYAATPIRDVPGSDVVVVGGNFAVEVVVLLFRECLQGYLWSNTVVRCA